MSARSLGWGEKVGYSAGDFAFNLFYTFSTLFLLYFYTDVLGLAPSTGGFIIMAALLLEAVADPLMGYVANRTHTRFGRYRPYLLFGALPLGLSFVAMFVPTGLVGSPLLAYSLATHLVFRLTYTVVGIPYISLSAEMTRDSRVRSQIAGMRMLFSTACAIVLSTATLPLAKLFGGGVQGFFRLSILYAVVAQPVFWACFATTRETPIEAGSSPKLRDIIAMLRFNWPLQVLLAATLLALVASTMFTKTLLYYLKYDVGSEQAMTTALTIVTASAALSIPLWIWVSARTSKRKVMLAGAVMTMVNSLIFYAVAPRLGIALWSILAFSGLANGALALSFWGMLPDTVEFGEWKNGLRAGGAIYGLVSLIQKLALGFGIGLLGALLDRIGYRPNAVQTQATLHGMRVLLTLVPAALAVAVTVLVWLYPIDHKMHGRLTRAIARRGRASARSRGG